METEQVTLEQIYMYLVSFRKDVEQRFTNIEYHLEMHDRQFKQLEKRMDRLEEKVQAIYDTRDKIKLDFNRRILLGNSLLAGVVAFIVAMFTGKYEMN